MYENLIHLTISIFYKGKKQRHNINRSIMIYSILLITTLFAQIPTIISHSIPSSTLNHSDKSSIVQVKNKRLIFFLLILIICRFRSIKRQNRHTNRSMINPQRPHRLKISIVSKKKSKMKFLLTIY